jgi:hypothetical protein
MSGMWYQASRTLNGFGEAKLENGNCVQVRWDQTNELTTNNYYELVSQYNKSIDSIELIREETVMVDGFLDYFDNSTGNLTLVNLAVLSTDYTNFAILYGCQFD